MHPFRILLTERTESLARIHLRPTEMDFPTGATLSGTLTGPRCRYARTLPTVFRVRELAGTAEVLITEPCYWTADMPFLYDLRIEVRYEGKVIDSREQFIGLRRLSVHGRHLFVEGNRFVFRAARGDPARSVDWAAWRDARLAMHVVNPDIELCHVASEQGVWIIAEMSIGILAKELMEYPAVGIAVVPPSELAHVERLSGGPLLGVRISHSEDFTVANGADLIVRDVQSTAAAKEKLSGCLRPAFAVRSTESFDSLSDARAACEALQRDLSPELNLAGYIV